MPGKDQEYIYQQQNPGSDIASRQSSENNRADGLKDDAQTHGDILQRENAKDKGSNKDHRDGKIGTEPGPKK